MIPLTPEPDDFPIHLRNEPEHCCLCGRATRTWYAPKDVPVCAECAATHQPEHVPTKEQWWGSPEARGVIRRPDGMDSEEKGMTDSLFETGSVARTVGITVNAPGVFARKDFMAWLNDPGNKTFTWHDIGAPTPHEYSDVVVLVDSNYEGDSSNMPQDIWKAICDLAYSIYGGPESPRSLDHHITVRLTNLA